MLETCQMCESFLKVVLFGAIWPGPAMCVMLCPPMSGVPFWAAQHCDLRAWFHLLLHQLQQTSQALGVEKRERGDVYGQKGSNSIQLNPVRWQTFWNGTSCSPPKQSSFTISHWCPFCCIAPCWSIGRLGGKDDRMFRYLLSCQNCDPLGPLAGCTTGERGIQA